MIRPMDLQNSILQSIQSASAVQRVEEQPRQAAHATQAAFAAEVTRRDEQVAESSDVSGNRVGAKSQQERQSGQRKRKHKPGARFDEVVSDADSSAEPAHIIDSDEPAHIIDFSA